MDNQDFAATLILIAAPIASAIVGCLCGLRVQRAETQRYRRAWDRSVARERYMSDAYASLCDANEDLSNRIAQYAAEEAKRLAPLQAANRKRREEAQARKGNAK